MTDAVVLPLTVLVPLALGGVAFAGSERTARRLLVPGWLGVSAMTLALARDPSRVRAVALGGWPVPLGIELRADALSLAFLGLGCAVYAAVLPFAAAYFRRDGREARRFWALAWLLWAALNAVCLSNDLFNLYVTLELLGFSAVGLAASSGERAALAAALRYLLAALVASNLFLLAVALVYGTTGVLALSALATRLDHEGAGLAVALLVSALVVKTALVPLHYWLPPAHGGAATPVSALLSGLVIKASFAILLRLWLLAAPQLDLRVLGHMLAWLGAAAIVWGSLLALVQTKVKMLVAYSTVAQVGYLFLPFAWIAPGSGGAGMALEAGVVQVLAHGVAKAAMFLAAGSLVVAAGRDDLDALRGAAARDPLAIFAFGLAATSLVGLPPSAGFAAKWQLLRAAVSAGQWGYVPIVIAGGLLAALYVFRVLRLAFLPTPVTAAGRTVRRAMPRTAFALALVAALGGLLAGPVLAGLDLPALARALE